MRIAAIAREVSINALIRGKSLVLNNVPSVPGVYLKEKKYMISGGGKAFPPPSAGSESKASRTLCKCIRSFLFARVNGANYREYGLDSTF